MTATTVCRPAVRELLHVLRVHRYLPSHGPKAPHLTTCWLSQMDAGRYALIVPAMYGPLDFLRLVTVRTVEEAVGAGLVELGDMGLMPVYNYGGAKYRWRTIQQGQPLLLTGHGRTVNL
jgi:hypothetical protein